MIEEYKFGLITINGRSYGHDVEVDWQDEVLPWRQRTRHIIDLEDIERALAKNPEVIVIGLGEQGTAEATDELKEELFLRGIELILDPTEQAAKTFNVIKEESLEEDGVQKKVIGLFHITS